MARIRLADERGIALVLALATLTVLTITATTALTMATRSSAHAGMDRAGVVAHALAEAGLNNAMSILANPANNAMNSSLLPSQTSQYVGGQVAWSGTLDTIAAMWTVTAVGTARGAPGQGSTGRGGSRPRSRSSRAFPSRSTTRRGTTCSRAAPATRVTPRSATPWT